MKSGTSNATQAEKSPCMCISSPNCLDSSANDYALDHSSVLYRKVPRQFVAKVRVQDGD